ncbi:MAG: uroporphyrinogen-III synthase [Blastocatellia bacterium]|nr:uroporphyrinogen-III synthase [Blastocatellia bacterium]
MRIPILLLLTSTLVLGTIAHPQNQSGEVANLLTRLKTGKDYEQVQAARSLGKLSVSASQIIPALAEVLKTPPSKEEHVYFRDSVAHALKNLVRPDMDGATTSVAVDGLIAALKVQKFGVVEPACIAVARIGPKAKAAVPALIEVLKYDWAPNVHIKAVFALGRIGPAAAPAMPDLVRMRDAPLRTFNIPDSDDEMDDVILREMIDTAIKRIQGKPASR